jgi:hypothetical protein
MRPYPKAPAKTAARPVANPSSFEAEYGQLLDDALRADAGLQVIFGSEVRQSPWLVDIVETARRNSFLFSRQEECLRDVIARHLDKSHAYALAKAGSKHVGAVGDRLKAITVTIDRLVWEGISPFGWPRRAFYMFALRTADGATLMYKGSKYLGESGDTLMISATVKEHAKYRGVSQTVIGHIRVVA